MKIKVKPVNYMTVSDEHISILIAKKPKRRYRQIIKAHYRRTHRRTGGEVSDGRAESNRDCN